MKKINTIKENNDFKRIMNTSKPCKNQDFLIFVEKNNKIEKYHFGISVSKKLGNAVTRNKLKRQVKSILDKKDYQKNFNCIIILRKEILNKSYSLKEKSLLELLNKFNIIVGEKNEK